ncbi:hypothetical protein GX51_05018 [Blastomyces parvus]|uniref:Uncharacterized protein n=1 Tax=Blastomyces parvus TaxID=2060905 RepID=A0A2B7WZK0_9EURO|nr:hypothetical protein GX51_05018 [Blastomyces parvus]
MKLQALLSLCFVGAVTVQAAAVQATPEKVDVVGGLKSHDQGFKHVGDDGVARSFGPDGIVIDAAALTNVQLLEEAKNHPDSSARKHLMELWKNVDGRNVPLEHHYSPPQNVLPLSLRDPEVKKELEAKQNEQLATYGQSPNKRSSILSPRACESIICKDTNWCQIYGCAYCRAYDQIKTQYCVIR